MSLRQGIVDCKERIAPMSWGFADMPIAVALCHGSAGNSRLVWGEPVAGDIFVKTVKGA